MDSQKLPQRKSYSDEEIHQIYELGKLYMEIGQVRKAETIMNGLNAVAPDFAPAWLATAYLAILSQNIDAAISASQNALRVDGNSVEAMLYLSSLFLTSGDYNSAGTYIGEAGEKIEAGETRNTHAMRFYKMQLARFQNR